MKNAKWIPPLMAALFAFPAFAQPLSLEDAVSADVKAQVYERQVTETSGASTAIQTDNGGPGSLTAEDMQAAPSVPGDADVTGKADPASAVKMPEAEPTVAANEHASPVAEHPEKPAMKPEPRKAHAVKHIRKKAV